MADDVPLYRHLSLWHESLVSSGEDDLRPRPGLDGDTEADVCIVGAGYTGLWAAHSLLVAEPGLRVVVLEAEIAGFGASGRNGGWCSALFPASTGALAQRHGREAALAMRRAMNATVPEVGRTLAAEGIDAHWRQGGTVVLARTPVQLARARAAVAADAAFHLAIVASTSSRRIRLAAEAAFRELRIVLAFADRVSGDLDEIAADHAGLMEVIVQAPPPSARAALLDHLRRSEQRVLAVV